METKAVKETLRDKAVQYVLSIPLGRIDPALLAPDFQAWSIISGDMPGEVFAGRIKVIPQVFDGGLAMEVLSTTAEDDRVAVQSRSEGTLFNGERYANVYHFLVEFDSNDRIRKAWEYTDSTVAQKVLIPAMQAWLKSQSTNSARAGKAI